MKHQLSSEEKEAMLCEYRSFTEFQAMTDEQLLALDQFLRSYSELCSNCFGRLEERAKVIQIGFDHTNLKAA